MPTIGGVSIGWDESAPGDSSSAGLGDDHMRSIKTSVRQGLDAEHNWPAAGGSSIGYHVFGSARPFWGTQSAVSSSGSDGRLMLTSDTSRLFGVGSGGTVYLGGMYGLSVGTTTGITLPQRAIWVDEFGVGSVTSKGSTTVTIPNSGYSGAPFVSITGVADVAGLDVKFQAAAITATSFVVNAIGSGGAFASLGTFHWFSRGTRTL